MPGLLYIVATPIGNLEDITLRALRVLKEVDLIAAEDTRHTQHLLSHYGIKTALTSYHEHNERAKAQTLIERISKGVNIALVSDAGTPAISDPGFRLVVEAIHAGVRVVPLPGACAMATVLSASGLPTDRFVFEGFLPAKRSERRARLLALREETRTWVFHEAPHRLAECLADLHELLGDREMVLAREVSKLHEEFVRGRASDVINRLANRKLRGEMTLVVRAPAVQPEMSEEAVKTEIRRLKQGGMRVKDIAEILGKNFGYAKKEIYRMTLELDKSTEP